jgi:hypothetical protein
MYNIYDYVNKHSLPSVIYISMYNHSYISMYNHSLHTNHIQAFAEVRYVCVCIGSSVTAPTATLEPRLAGCAIHP